MNHFTFLQFKICIVLLKYSEIPYYNHNLSPKKPDLKAIFPLKEGDSKLK